MSSSHTAAYGIDGETSFKSSTFVPDEGDTEMVAADSTPPLLFGSQEAHRPQLAEPQFKLDAFVPSIQRH